ncbi:10642_t:CDS:2, partial [Funneliformis geosporum]
LSNGDGGVDLMGNFAGYLLLIQCKNYGSDTKVTVDDVREFSGIMAKYPEKSIGIFVTPSNNYTRRAIEEAQNSQFKIILTDTLNIYHDIRNNIDDDFTDDNYIRFHIGLHQTCFALFLMSNPSDSLSTSSLALINSRIIEPS